MFFLVQESSLYSCCLVILCLLTGIYQLINHLQVYHNTFWLHRDKRGRSHFSQSLTVNSQRTLSIYRLIFEFKPISTLLLPNFTTHITLFHPKRFCTFEYFFIRRKLPLLYHYDYYIPTSRLLNGTQI